MRSFCGEIPKQPIDMIETELMNIWVVLVAEHETKCSLSDIWSTIVSMESSSLLGVDQ